MTHSFISFFDPIPFFSSFSFSLLFLFFSFLPSFYFSLPLLPSSSCGLSFLVWRRTKTDKEKKKRKETNAFDFRPWFSSFWLFLFFRSVAFLLFLFSFLEDQTQHNTNDQTTKQRNPTQQTRSRASFQQQQQQQQQPTNQPTTTQLFTLFILFFRFVSSFRLFNVFFAFIWLIYYLFKKFLKTYL